MSIAVFKRPNPSYGRASPKWFYSFVNHERSAKYD